MPTSWMRRYIAVVALVLGVPALAAVATGHPLHALAWVLFSGIFATFAIIQHDPELDAEVDRIAGPMPAYSAGTPLDRWRLRREHRRRRKQGPHAR
jgi:hypothetical protein